MTELKKMRDLGVRLTKKGVKRGDKLPIESSKKGEVEDLNNCRFRDVENLFNCGVDKVRSDLFNCGVEYDLFVCDKNKIGYKLFVYWANGFKCKFINLKGRIKE